MPELLVVFGIMSLLMAILLPPLQIARRQAMQTQCGAHLHDIAVALDGMRNEYRGFYPVWDDNGSPVRYTWVDVLVQRGYLSDRRAGYCPQDPQPDSINAARGAFYGLQYPGKGARPGIDYSYGIGVPLSAAGWIWQPAFAGADDKRPRRLEGYERYPAQRVLVADSNWSGLYNLSGNALRSNDWSDQYWYDNTVSWRHTGNGANVLHQDGHVEPLKYRLDTADPIDTNRSFLWFPNEPLHVGPDDRSDDGNWYPNCPPFDLRAPIPTDVFPRELVPEYYTKNHLWTKFLDK